MTEISREDKLQYMKDWCFRNKCVLELEGECGFGRECVGILVNDIYPDYRWYDEKTYARLDINGEVWIPEDAYHKHECVAVLGRGESSEDQLYQWLKWFDDNNFKLETGSQEVNPSLGYIAYLLGQDKYARMVKE